MNSNNFRYFLAPSERSLGGEAVIPLPNPGEGGPVYPGDDMLVEPVIPLPYPGEGGPVYPGDDIPVEPVIPLPNPGEGGPVYPGPFRVTVANSRFANRLNFASVTGYGRVYSGFQTVTVTGMNGYVYIRKSMPFQTNGLTTIAIVNPAGGIDLTQIADRCCPPSNGWSSFRVGNLAYNSGPLDVVMSDGRVVYSDLRYKEVAPFRRIVPGAYQFFYADTGLASMPASLAIEPMDSDWLGVYPPYETFGSLYLDVNAGDIYTVYLIQKGSGRNNIQNLILVDG